MPSVKERAAMFAANTPKSSPSSIDNKSGSGSRSGGSNSTGPSLELPVQQTPCRESSNITSSISKAMETTSNNQENVPPNGRNSSEEKSNRQPCHNLKERDTGKSPKTLPNAAAKVDIRHKPSASVSSSLTTRNNEATDAKSKDNRRATTSVFTRLAGTSSVSSKRISPSSRSAQPVSSPVSTKPAATIAAKSAVVTKPKPITKKVVPTETTSASSHPMSSRGVIRTTISNTPRSSTRPTSSSSSADKSKTVSRPTAKMVVKNNQASEVMPKIRNTERGGSVVSNHPPISGHKKTYSEKEVGQLRQESINQMEKLKQLHAEEIIGIRQAFDTLANREIDSLDIPGSLESEDQSQISASQVTREPGKHHLRNGELSSLQIFEYQGFINRLRSENEQQIDRAKSAETELASSYAIVKSLEKELKQVDETKDKNQDRELDRLRSLHEKELASKPDELHRMEHNKEEAFSKSLIALKSEIEAMEKENEFLRKKIEQQVDSRKKEIESIENVKKTGLHEQQSLQERVVRYEEENQALRSEISGDKGLRAQLQDARDQFEKRKSISSKRETEAQKQIDELQAVIESLKTKLVSLEGKCSGHEKTLQTLQQSHETEISDYQRRLEQERRARAASEYERPFSPNLERGGGDARLMAQLDSPRSPRPGFI